MKIRRLKVVAWLLFGTAATLLAADGTWVAPGGGAWSDTANWQNQTVAEGSGATATFDVGSGTVSNDMTALALRGVLLGGAGYTLAGNTLALDAAGFITILGGNHTVGLPLTLGGPATFSLASGRTLTVNGAISGTGGLELYGGRTVLGAANTYAGPTVLVTGILEVASTDALGSSSDDPANLVLGDGTFRYTGPSATLSRGYTLLPGPDTNRAAIIDIPDADTTLTIAGQVAAPGGSFIKTGEGTLRYTYPGFQELSKSKGAGNQAMPLVIDENGSAGTDGFMHFTVDKGRVILGAPGQTNQITGWAGIGNRTLASPRMDIIGGVTRFIDSIVTIGRGTGTSASPQQPSLYISNGAFVEVPFFVMGFPNGQPDFYSEPCLHIDGATLRVTGNCFLSESANLKSTVVITNGGLFQCDSTEWDRGMSLSQTAGAQTDVHVNGSTVRTYQMRLGRGANLNVGAGGTVELDTTPGNVTAGTPTLNLGTARFSGATLKQRTANLISDWFVDVTNLLVGTDGLTLDVDSHAWLGALPKADPASAGGSLTKTGPGRLVLTPTALDIQVNSGTLALSTAGRNHDAAVGTVTLGAGSALEIGAAQGAAGMTLDLNGGPLLLTPHTLSSTPGFWVFTNNAMRRADGYLQLTRESGKWNAVQHVSGAAHFWRKIKVDTPWTVRFGYTCWALGSNPADGVCLVMHNDPRGMSALGSTGGNLGYGGGSDTRITNSVAVGLDVYQHQLRFGRQGAFVSSRALPSLPKLAVQPVKSMITVSYDGTGKLVVLIDYPGSPVCRQAWLADVAAEVGNSEAFIGFVGSTGGSQGQHAISDVTFESGDAPPAYSRTGGRLSLTAGETLNAVAETSPVQRGYVLGDLAYGDQSVLNLETRTTPVPEPTLHDAGLWSLNGKAFWKAPGRLAVSSNFTWSSGSAYTTNAYPVADSWTARFNYDIGLMSTPPADYVTFAIQGQTPTSTSHTPNPGFAIQWRYYQGDIRTTQLKMFTNGVEVTATTDLTPVNLATGGPAQMTVSHDAAARTVTVITEQAAGVVTNVFSGVDVPTATGAATAYVGFGAFTGGSYAENIVSDFSFTTTPLASPALPAYVAFDTMSGSGTLIKRGAAALGLMGDDARPTSDLALRLEQGGLVLGKASHEPVSSRNSAGDWIFSDKLGGCDDTLKICEYQSYFVGTAMSLRRIRIGVPWTATFKMLIGKSTSSPADGFSFFLHNAPERLGRATGITSWSGFQDIPKSFGLRWLFYPYHGAATRYSTCIGRNGSWDSSTAQSYLPVMLSRESATAFSLRYEPETGTLTSVMSRDGLVSTNIFTGINLVGDVQDTMAYVGFGSGTGGAYQELFLSDFRVTYDTPADATSGPDYLAALTLPDASANTITLDTSLTGGLFRIASATLGDGATLGVAAAREPGTLVLGTTALAGDAAFEIGTGCTLAATDVTGGTDIVKRGTGTLALAGAAAAHTGDTHLEAGTLALDAARLPRTTDLHVTSGATLNLAFTGKQHVHALFVDGAPMPGGRYTAENAAWITGPGALIVTYPPSGSILFLR